MPNHFLLEKSLIRSAIEQAQYGLSRPPIKGLTNHAWASNTHPGVYSTHYGYLCKRDILRSYALAGRSMEEQYGMGDRGWGGDP